MGKVSTIAKLRHGRLSKSERKFSRSCWWSAWPGEAHCDWLGLLPVSQQVSGAALHSPVLLNDLHLQVCHLLLDGRVLPPHDVIEGSPLSLNVVNIEPGRWELEPLLLQQALPIAVEL